MSKPFAFKPSALAAKADKLWSESKTDFSATHSTVNHVHLEKKSLGDIAQKNASAQKEKEVEETVAPTFVFGSKIADRIVKTDGETSKSGESDEKTMTATELFKTAVKKDDDKNEHKDFREEAQQEAERTKEVEKQHAGTSAVEITSGEENDTNIFQAPCKIWAFDKARSAYVEKGVCTLRINKRVENGMTHHRIGRYLIFPVSHKSSVFSCENFLGHSSRHNQLENFLGYAFRASRETYKGKFLSLVNQESNKSIIFQISAMGPEISGVQIFLLKIGFTKTETIPDSDRFYNIMSDLLKLEKGENCRKRKADCDLNASSVKIKDGKEDEEGEQDQVDEGFVIVNKPTDEEIEESERASAEADAGKNDEDEPSTAPAPEEDAPCNSSASAE
ncbi:Protein CBR-RAN-5 [Caenorhabditis briggsae]|uniref:Protein CBR-RAN-5 n=1 Tax=Caenorhabditis briggsae TaxID=6238 RepID=A8WU10_CAEBR|nr:Protein CBR-RAN-5 [Caenorhabditis briggsae]CAP23972.2 Protein CBR-RAN-5 [Caenorhabditis briggsae]